MKSKLTLENLSQFIESESTIYIDKARSYGIELAKENKPKAFQDSLSPYISSIVAQFKSLWTKVETEIDEDIIKKDSEISMYDKEATHKQQEDALLEIKTKIKQVEDQIGRLADDYNWQLFIPLLLFSFALIFSESYFNSSFMQQVMRDISSLQAKALSFTIYALLFLLFNSLTTGLIIQLATGKYMLKDLQSSYSLLYCFHSLHGCEPSILTTVILTFLHSWHFYGEFTLPYYRKLLAPAFPLQKSNQ
ncbi:MAG: hypothetical protein IPK03_03450 [Bacteroidetes bacterium]|nr:hypothetical protein [Bacteroidota bacterium]